MAIAARKRVASMLNDSCGVDRSKGKPPMAAAMQSPVRRIPQKISTAHRAAGSDSPARKNGLDNHCLNDSLILGIFNLKIGISFVLVKDGFDVYMDG